MPERHWAGVLPTRGRRDGGARSTAQPLLWPRGGASPQPPRAKVQGTFNHLQPNQRPTLAKTLSPHSSVCPFPPLASLNPHQARSFPHLPLLPSCLPPTPRFLFIPPPDLLLAPPDLFLLTPPPGLFLPASELKAVRRQAADQMLQVCECRHHGCCDKVWTGFRLRAVHESRKSTGISNSAEIILAGVGITLSPIFVTISLFFLLEGSSETLDRQWPGHWPYVAQHACRGRVTPTGGTGGGSSHSCTISVTHTRGESCHRRERRQGQRGRCCWLPAEQYQR